MRVRLGVSLCLGLALVAAVTVAAPTAQTVFSAKRSMYYEIPSGYAGPVVRFIENGACPAPLTRFVPEQTAIDECRTVTEYERTKVVGTRSNGCFSAFTKSTSGADISKADPNTLDLATAKPNITYKACPACTTGYGATCNSGCTVSTGSGYGTTNICPNGIAQRPVCNITVTQWVPDSTGETYCVQNPVMSPGEEDGRYSCGFTSKLWNVPAGAAIFYESSSDQPIQAVILGIKERYAHVALSLGDKGLAHATASFPGHRDADPFDIILDPGGLVEACDHPLFQSDLKNLRPGAELINLGAVRADLQSGTYRAPRDSSKGPELANWVLNNADKFTVGAENGYPGASYTRFRRNGSSIPYGLYQYMNIEATNELNSSSTYNGMICSTFMSWVHAQANLGVIQPYTYQHSTVAEQMDTMNALARDTCIATMNGSQRDMVDTACFWQGNGVCSRAAHQITNCFVSPSSCGSNNPAYWRAVRDDPSATSRTISPDRIAGYDKEYDPARPVEPPTTELRHRNVNSAWSAGDGTAPSAQVLWNQPGNVYGCWR